MPDLNGFEFSIIFRGLGLVVALLLTYRSWLAFYYRQGSDTLWDFLAGVTFVGAFAALVVSALGAHLAFDVGAEASVIETMAWANWALSAFSVFGAVTLLLSWRPAKGELV